MRGLVPLAALLLLGGCAAPMREDSAESAGDVTASSDGRYLESEERGDGDGYAGDDADTPLAESVGAGGDAPADEGPEANPNDQPPEDTASDPYAERAGTKDDAERDALPARVAFREPTSRQRPVELDMRPRLPERARLAVVSVREGEIEHLPGVVLDLQALLRKEEAIKAVLSLGAPRLASVGLKELAAQAKAEGRDLLLVDVRPGSPGNKRSGYLLHTRKGSLLARYDVPEDPEGADVSAGADADLCARLGVLYARAKD